jgi:hypothetical protein
LFLSLNPVFAQGGPGGVWLDNSLPSSFVAASYNNGTGWLAVRRSSAATACQLQISLGTVLDIDRVSIGSSSDVFILSSANLLAGTGLVTAITLTGGVFGTPAVLWSGQGCPASVDYAPLLGELLVLDETLPAIRWATFAPASLAVGEWGIVPIDTAGVSESTGFGMSVVSESSLGQTLAIVSCENMRGSRIQLTLGGGGSFTQAMVDPILGSDFGICQSVIVESGVVGGFGPPGAILEAFSVGTNVTRGIGVADSEGYAAIPVTGVSVGEVVAVRDLISGAGTGASRRAFSEIGSAIAGPTLAPSSFGPNAAATLVAGDADFRILCLADATAGAPEQYPAIAVAGLPSNVVLHPTLGHMMVGAEVIIFPAGMRRSAMSVSGCAHVPIPSSAVGLTLCLQWMALDGANLVSSNIACMCVQATN